MTLRQLSWDDMESLAELEASCFETPWSQEDYEIQFEEVPGTAALGLEHGGRLVAAAVYTPADPGLYVLTLAVHEDYRRRGLATRLVRELVALGKSLTLHVRAGDRGARTLYRGLGFFDVRTESGFYEDNGEDAVLMLRP